MRVIPTTLPEVLILEPRVFGDERGFFLESYNRRTFNDAVDMRWNSSRTITPVPCEGSCVASTFSYPACQGKLVRVASAGV